MKSRQSDQSHSQESAEQVILVNELDEPTGVMEKLEAHRMGLLHRAFSVLIFNDKQELLLQQRALSKYHSPGLWTNSCCSHPRPGETIEEAATRRLYEEMGIITELNTAGNFIYKCEFSNGLTEHEFDYVLRGNYNHNPVINTDEVHAYRWISQTELHHEMKFNSGTFTFWFHQLVLKGFV